MLIDKRILRLKYQNGIMLLERIMGSIIYLGNYNKNKNNAIVVYTYGKVGSSTMYYTLKKYMPLNKIYHSHVLTKEKLLERLNNGYDEKSKQQADQKSLKLNYLIDKDKKIRLKIISIVREPISRQISDLFENWETIFGNMMFDDLDIKTVEDKLSNSGSMSYLKKWFDEEFKESTGINIFNLNFDKEKGYSIYRFDDFDLLMMKLENIDDIFIEAIQDFLNIEMKRMRVVNTAHDKKGYAKYKQIKKELRIDREILKRNYSKDYIRHFYTDKQISTFVERWSKDKQ